MSSRSVGRCRSVFNFNVDINSRIGLEHPYLWRTQSMIRPRCLSIARMSAVEMTPTKAGKSG